MDNTQAAVVTAISCRGEYRERFGVAYGDTTIDFERVADALGAYMASRISGNSAVDRFEAGDKVALSAEAQARGRSASDGRARR